jgi:NAD(P)-dependent dehydrogenase (short-subunit alcohol dehydrogenase family)
MSEGNVLVTGATSGIGLAVTEALAEKGYHVIALGRSASKIATLQTDLETRFGASAVEWHEIDLSDLAATATLAADLVSRYSSFHALVNAAGSIKLENTHDVSAASYQQQMDVLFRAPFFLTAAILPSMIQAGGGTIVNIGSVVAEKASPKMAVYAAAKAALLNFTKTLALEYADKKIRAVCIQPGGVQTALMDKIMFAMIQKRTPLKRLATPQEVAALVLFALSPEASLMTGSTLTLDGGISL